MPVLIQRQPLSSRTQNQQVGRLEAGILGKAGTIETVVTNTTKTRSILDHP
jgi:hypothetical protein